MKCDVPFTFHIAENIGQKYEITSFVNPNQMLTMVAYDLMDDGTFRVGKIPTLLSSYAPLHVFLLPL